MDQDKSAANASRLGCFFVASLGLQGLILLGYALVTGLARKSRLVARTSGAE